MVAIRDPVENAARRDERTPISSHGVARNAQYR